LLKKCCKLVIIKKMGPVFDTYIWDNLSKST